MWLVTKPSVSVSGAKPRTKSSGGCIPTRGYQRGKRCANARAKVEREGVRGGMSEI